MRKKPPPIDVSTFIAWIAIAMHALIETGCRYRKRLLPTDAIQLALAKAWKLWNDDQSYFLSAAHLLNWLRQTAYRISVDEHRSEKRHPTLPLPFCRQIIDERSNPDKNERWTPADQRTVWECVQLLEPLDRAIIEGHYIDDRTDRELAQEIFNNPDNPDGPRVSRMRYRALRRLQELLLQHGIDGVEE